MYKRALKTTEEILHATKHNLQDGTLSQGDIHEYTYMLMVFYSEEQSVTHFYYNQKVKSHFTDL